MLSKLSIEIILAVIVALMARSKGYNWIFWFFLTMIFPFSLIIMIFLPKKKTISVSGLNQEKEPLYRCTGCGRMIPINAAVCSHCGKNYDIIEAEKSS